MWLLEEMGEGEHEGVVLGKGLPQAHCLALQPGQGGLGGLPIVLDS